MGRVVLATEIRRITGNISMPNGGGATSQSSTSINIHWAGDIKISFSSQSGSGYGWGGGGGAGTTGHIKGFDSSRTITASRGSTYITGTFWLECQAELVQYTSGKTVDSDASPEDYYPDYGGPRVIEYPHVHCSPKWEWKPGSRPTVGITLGSQSVSVTSDYSVSIPDSIYVDIGVTDDSWYNSGGACHAEVWWDGIDLLDEPRGITIYGKHDGQSYNPEELGGAITIKDGYVSCMNIGWIRQDNTQADIVSLAATMYSPHLADFGYDAYAGEEKYPYDCDWTLIDKWIYVRDGVALEEPEPHYVYLKGQSVGYSIQQTKCLLNWGTYNKSITRIEKVGTWMPFTGYIGADYYDYDHFELSFGPVSAWITPPPGEHAKDWRVGFRGKQYQALTLTHGASLIVAPVWTTTDSKNYKGTFSAPSVWEGYRFLRVQGAATQISINGKTWKLDSSDAIIDLCYPDNAAVDADTTNSRWPLDSDLITTVEGPLYGCNVVREIIANGAITTLTLIRQFRNTTTGLKPLESWNEFKPSVHHENQNGSSGEWDENYFVQRVMIGNVDGRQSLELYDLLRVQNTAPNRKYEYDYYPQTIDQIRAQIAMIPGYTVSLRSDYPDDYHNQSLGAYNMGHGWYLSGGTWTTAFDRLGNPLAQPIFDSFDIPPMTGDIYKLIGAGSSANKRVQLRGRKTFRSQAWGLLEEMQTHAQIPDPVYTIIATNNDNSTKDDIEKLQDGNSAEFRVGPTQHSPNLWGAVYASQRKIDGVWPVQTTRVGVGGISRLQQRVAWLIREKEKGGRDVDSFHDEFGRYHVAFVNDDKRIVYKRASCGYPPGGHFECTYTFDDANAFAPFLFQDNNATIYCGYCVPSSSNTNFGKLRIYRSHDDGASWPESVHYDETSEYGAGVYNQHSGLNHIAYLSPLDLNNVETECNIKIETYTSNTHSFATISTANDGRGSIYRVKRDTVDICAVDDSADTLIIIARKPDDSWLVIASNDNAQTWRQVSL